jgi:hypothetical protein
VRTADEAFSSPFNVSAGARSVRGRRARTSTGIERSTVSGAAPLRESGTRPSTALAVTTTTRARAALRAWAVDSAMGWNGTSLVQRDVGKRQPPWVALYHRLSMDETSRDRQNR